MKYTELDMQEVPRQMSPLTQVQNNRNGIQDRSIWRNSRRSDTSNNNSSKEAPEVIDLDAEDPPISEKVEAALSVNGVTATVKKVTLPWQDKVTSDANKLSIIKTTNDTTDSSSENITPKEPVVSAANEEVLGNKPSEGPRKRQSSIPENDCSPKRSKILDIPAKEVLSSKVEDKCLENGLEKQTSKEPVEYKVVDLVEDDDVLDSVEKKSEENVNVVKPEKETSMTVSSKTEECKVINEEPVSPAERLEVSVPVPPNSEEKRSAIINTQKPTIEVKKVTWPTLDRQSPAVTTPTAPALVAAPQTTTGTALMQNQLAVTSSSPETASVPPPSVIVKSSAPETAKEFLKQCTPELSASEVESKVKLNPVHSKTREMLKKLTRSELESFLMEMACDLLISKSETGRFQKLYEEVKEASECKSLKISHLTKQVNDLSSVVQQVVAESKTRTHVLPQRVTRSVGLQLDPSSIDNTYKAKSKGDRIVMAQSTNYLGNTPPSSVQERLQSQKFRNIVSSTSKTGTNQNAVIVNPNVKDATPNSSLNNRSPQRQLKAIHPKPKVLVSNSVTSGTLSSGARESSKKSTGFIDISDENRLLNSGASINILSQKNTSIVGSSSNNGSTNSTLNSLNTTQSPSSSMKVVPQHYGQQGNLSSQGNTNARVVTTTIAAGTAVSGSRLTYLIPSSNSVPVQPGKLLFTAPVASQQIRGKNPVNQGNPIQAMVVRQSSLVQVQPTISTPPGAVMKTTPNNSLQILNARIPAQQQQTSRVVAIQGRPPLATRVPPMQHPAPLPAQPQSTVVDPNLKPVPRRPVLKLSKVANGIVLSWNMTMATPQEEIASYQLYAYQEGTSSPPSPSLWKKVGDVKALPLPMACTLTQFAEGHTYHFAVRALDIHGRVGEFSLPGTIELFSGSGS